MGNYTKGPWRAKDGMVYAENGDGATIANVNNEANARLIAASPDMEKALRGFVADYKEYLEQGGKVFDEKVLDNHYRDISTILSKIDLEDS